MSDRYRNDDWDTSKDAGDAADPKGECRAAVHLAHIDNPKGLTDAEMGAIVDERRDRHGLPRYPIDSMRKRRTDLYHDGILVETGERRASAETGRTMNVWQLATGTPVPVQPRSRRAPEPTPTPPDVSEARGIIESWAEQNKPGGMLVTAPDWDALQKLLDHAK